jgi:hypothetical protein
MMAALQALYRKGRDQWLFQLRDAEPGTVTLTSAACSSCRPAPGWRLRCCCW